MSHRSTSYTERNGLGENIRHTQFVPASDAYRREVYAWFEVWRGLKPQQQAAWRALTKAQRTATTQLSAADFSAVMGK